MRESSKINGDSVRERAVQWKAMCAVSGCSARYYRFLRRTLSFCRRSVQVRTLLSIESPANFSFTTNYIRG